MSNTLEEASSWSFCPKPFEHTKKIKASRAIYAVKKKIQEGIHQHEGMACCVMVGNPRQMLFVTSSHVVAKLKARDHEPIEMHPSDKEKRKGGPVVVCSTVKEFGPFSFLAMDVPKLGVGSAHEYTRLDFKEIPEEKCESDFEAYTFDGSENPLQLKFQYQKNAKKHELLDIKKGKPELNESFVLGAPIIVENTNVNSLYLSSRWSVVGVMGLNNKSELCPYFVYANIFDSRPAQSEGERSVAGNELNTPATNTRLAQSEGERSVAGNELNTPATNTRLAQSEGERSVAGNELNTPATNVGVHCIFRTLSGVLLVVGSGSILRRCSTLGEFVIAFGVAVLPTAVLLRDMFEGSVCFVVQAETSLALEELYERYRTGRLRRDLQEFLVTDDIRQLADGEEVVLSVYINEKELREVLDDLTNVDVEAREATVWSSIRAVSQRIKGEVGVYCTFRTLSDVLLLVGTGSILRRCSTLDDYVIAFGVAVLPTAVILRSVSEGSVCFMVQAETSLALEELYERYRTGRLQRDLQEFLVTDDIRQLADGEEVVLSVYINEKELREVLDDLTDVERKGN
ncbi:uncharacterized protein [Acropora muricata]|uniref:uncharacterized protein isoform X4 n=1 Tax=Acropora muricata TaxID=159855 RepID=UPI0034E40BCE